MTAASSTTIVPPASPEPPPEAADDALVRAALAGDELSFRLLYRRHSPRLRGLILRLLGDASGECDDVLQVVWLRAMLGVARFRWSAPFSSWLCGIAVRASMEALRQQRGGVLLPLDHDAIGASTDIVFRIDVENAIARVPAHYRVVFVLHDIEGFTHEEIAQQLGIPVGTSKANLHRARRLMRTMLGSFIAGEAP